MLLYTKLGTWLINKLLSLLCVYKHNKGVSYTNVRHALGGKA